MAGEVGVVVLTFFPSPGVEGLEVGNNRLLTPFPGDVAVAPVVATKALQLDQTVFLMTLLKLLTFRLNPLPPVSRMSQEVRIHSRVARRALV